jgi:hypothetical protein
MEMCHGESQEEGQEESQEEVILALENSAGGIYLARRLNTETVPAPTRALSFLHLDTRRSGT